MHQNTATSDPGTLSGMSIDDGQKRLARISHKVTAAEADIPASTALRSSYAKATADKSDKVLDVL
jgi:hypothetical protein